MNHKKAWGELKSKLDEALMRLSAMNMDTTQLFDHPYITAKFSGVEFAYNMMLQIEESIGEDIT